MAQSERGIIAPTTTSLHPSKSGELAMQVKHGFLNLVRESEDKDITRDQMVEIISAKINSATVNFHLFGGYNGETPYTPLLATAINALINSGILLSLKLLGMNPELSLGTLISNQLRHLDLNMGLATNPQLSHNVNDLLEGEFPYLQTLNLSFSLYFDITSKMGKFLGEKAPNIHKMTLTVLEVEQKNTYFNDKSKKMIARSDDHPDFKDPVPEFISALKQAQNLELLRIESSSLEERANEFGRFFETQTSLVYLSFPRLHEEKGIEEQLQNRFYEYSKKQAYLLSVIGKKLNWNEEKASISEANLTPAFMAELPDKSLDHITPFEKKDFWAIPDFLAKSIKKPAPNASYEEKKDYVLSLRDYAWSFMTLVEVEIALGKPYNNIYESARCEVAKEMEALGAAAIGQTNV